MKPRNNREKNATANAIHAMLKSLPIPEEDQEHDALDLVGTPERVARMWRDELLSGYGLVSETVLADKFKVFISDGHDGMIVEGPFDYWSTCAHHMLPFYGEAYIGYIPGDYLMGASKPARVLEHFARRLQIQERLMRQVADYIMAKAEPKAVVVMLRGKHLCMSCRGVMQANAKMVSTHVLPDFGQGDDSKTRSILNEFYQLVRNLDGK